MRFRLRRRLRDQRRDGESRGLRAVPRMTLSFRGCCLPAPYSATDMPNAHERAARFAKWPCYLRLVGFEMPLALDSACAAQFAIPDSSGALTKCRELQKQSGNKLERNDKTASPDRVLGRKDSRF